MSYLKFVEFFIWFYLLRNSFDSFFFLTSFLKLWIIWSLFQTKYYINFDLFSKPNITSILYAKENGRQSSIFNIQGIKKYFKRYSLIKLILHIVEIDTFALQYNSINIFDADKNWFKLQRTFELNSGNLNDYQKSLL